eukprot:TRINITY_DN7506_c0_g1_i2.p1 TRINITY_DN7506_c0_g1~~TRINITY_DN7506_c0_g1_i2.p1  ORF type:complete len:244 (+),score=48.97 TRINITY_DN7506_c0_g1_i2:85-816(+)
MIQIRMKLRSCHLVEDLYEVFGPPVAQIRGQCGLLELIKGFGFKRIDETKRQSQRQKVIHMILHRTQGGKQRMSLVEMAFSLKESELFNLFVNDFTSMLEKRGLIMQSLPSGSIQYDEEINLQLSSADLYNVLDINSVASTAHESAVDSVKSLLLSDQRAAKWLQHVMSLHEKFPNPLKRSLPPRNFRTRNRQPSVVLSRGSLRHIFDQTTANSLARVTLNAVPSVIEDSFQSNCNITSIDIE